MERRCGVKAAPPASTCRRRAIAVNGGHVLLLVDETASATTQRDEAFNPSHVPMHMEKGAAACVPHTPRRPCLMHVIRLAILVCSWCESHVLIFSKRAAAPRNR